ncbi:MAG: 2-oxoglutarate dehydrogenase, E2 component, dihydrolipoamide succinyltransferase [Candidatus Kapabacteria bacterium]|nr:2-oxoglutarate dehydrogenase, E2 component, dihydrolipoamide succinyltransferase [Candidatus Kapabacteria bacterium]
MRVEILMPKMGESLQEGTILKWLKKEGDAVERDEMILEISTDKVDTEVPSPVSGVLSKILFPENETVEVGKVIAYIETEGVAEAMPKDEPVAKTEPKVEEKIVEKPSKEEIKTDIASSVQASSIVDVVMPKMGESLQEGTILKWLKKEGDAVERDEMILEISTDKVDTEVPSPVSGVLIQILAKESETVEVGKVIAKISVADGSSVGKPSEVQAVTEEISQETKIEIPQKTIEEEQTSQASNRFYSPLVKSIAKAEGISFAELDTIQGTGLEGRVTKNDILKYIENRKKAPVQETKPIVEEQKRIETVKPAPQKTEPSPIITPPSVGADVEIIPMDRVRQLIAEHMIYSKHTSAHVTSVAEADVTGIVKFREKYKTEFEKREGFKLTYTPFFAKAAVDGVRAFPRVNVSVDGKNIILHKKIHLSVATALEDGNLIVPVIKNADALSISGLARAVYDLSTRARSKKLNPDDIQGGTFTITNVGTFGTLFGTPVINQPQTAIMGIGAIKKRPVVKEIDGEDIIVVRHIAYVSITYDHRVIDGQLAGQCLAAIVKSLESMNEKTISL